MEKYPTTQTLKYWDHARNLVRPAEAQASARARESCRNSGELWTVTWQWPGSDEAIYSNGCKHDMLGLAKDLCRSPKGPLVVLEEPGGGLIHHDEIIAARY